VLRGQVERHVGSRLGRPGPRRTTPRGATGRPGAPVRPYTYIPTGEGWLYLAAVLDAFSRRVVGWAMADHLRTELVLDALELVWDGRSSRVPSRQPVSHA
jgi:transposase InsO family protein